MFRTALFCLALVASTLAGSQEVAEGNQRIVGGTRVASGLYPFQVAISITYNGQSDLCGGSLIAADWVMTAAHCVQDRGRTIRARHFIVDVGGEPLGKGQLREVRRIYVPRSYDDLARRSDIALLKLKEPVDDIEPIALAGNPEADSFPFGGLATVTGYGDTTFGGSGSSDLLEVKVPLIERDRCRALFAAGAVTADHICAGSDIGGRDACQGDSGGPLFVEDEDSGFRQIGIVSWGEGCGDAGAYGVYTRVATMRPFLERYAKPSFVGDAPPDPTPAILEKLLDGLTSTATRQVEITGPTVAAIGEEVAISVDAPFSGHLVLFDVNSRNSVRQLFPNALLSPKDFRVSEGPVEVPDPSSGVFFSVSDDAPRGPALLVAILFRDAEVLRTLTDRFDASGPDEGSSPQNRAEYLAELLHQAETTNKQVAFGTLRYSVGGPFAESSGLRIVSVSVDGRSYAADLTIEGGQLRGYLPCNALLASVALEDDHFAASRLSTTRKRCDAQAMAQEQAILKALSRPLSRTERHGALTVFGDGAFEVIVEQEAAQ